MFTGIIKNQGIVIKKQEQGRQIRLVFRLLRREENLELGESIAVDGVCLSVVRLGPRTIEMDIIRETLAATTLGMLDLGDRVNLERSLEYGDRMGGHFVTGHIDGRGQIVKIEKQGRNRTFHFQASPKLVHLLARKGSVAVDGISLTVQAVRGSRFQIGLIPLTLRETSLGRKKEGDYVNLEIDLVTRYLANILKAAGGKTRKPLSLAGLLNRMI